MADEDDPKKPGRFRRTMRGARRVFLPGKPVGLRPEVGSTRWIYSAIRRSRRTCPNCREGDLVMQDVINDAGDIEGRYLVCQVCETEQNVDELVSDVVANIEKIRSAERAMIILALVIVVGFGLLAYLTGQTSTFLVALCFGIILLIRAMAFRYRAWQAANMRLFEERPPIGAWIRDELSAK